MANDKFRYGGASMLGDLVKMGGDVSANLTNEQIKNMGAGFWQDMARTGGDVNALAISGAPVLTGQDGVAYAGFTVSASGGVPPYTYSLVGTWPAGITVDADTGEVSGTPSEDGSFASLSVRATDDDSATADLPTFTLVIAAA